VCKEGIQESLEAHNEVFRWLGWHYGSFIEKTKKAALNHLMLSAISEGLIHRQKEMEKEKLRLRPKVEVPVIENDNGQLTLAI
jgi:DNA sulfur modification protein DndC